MAYLTNYCPLLLYSHPQQRYRVSIAIGFSNCQLLCCDAQRFGDHLARALPHGFLGVGALQVR
jgi:hypothetical protein